MAFNAKSSTVAMQSLWEDISSMNCFNQLEDCTHRLPVLLYWFFVPVYFVSWILFGSKGHDPLGRYGYLTEWGKATYD